MSSPSAASRGGSVGGAVFAALVRQERAGMPFGTAEALAAAARLRHAPAGAGTLRGLASAVLGNDYLSSPLTAMMFSDVFNSWFRKSWYAERYVAGRAATHEAAFEESWRGIVDSDLLAGPIEGLWDGDAALRVPSLFLNCTDAADGARLVVGPLALGPEFDPAADLRGRLGGRTLRLSTAMMLSARFPIISPAGALPLADGTAPSVVDGGYYDNSGAGTAADVLEALRRAAAGLNLEGRLRYVVLLIENEPDAPPAAAAPPAPAPKGSLLDPVVTLVGVREGYTRRFAAELKRRVADAGGVTLDRLKPAAGRVDFPLGWMLSEATRDALDGQITAFRGDPRSHYAEALRLLPSRRP